MRRGLRHATFINQNENMNRIIEDAGEMVYNGAKFYINFEKRSLSVNGKYLIKDGKHELPLGCWHKEDFPEERCSNLLNSAIATTSTRYHQSVRSRTGADTSRHYERTSYPTRI